MLLEFTKPPANWEIYKWVHLQQGLSTLAPLTLGAESFFVYPLGVSCVAL